MGSSNVHGRKGDIFAPAPPKIIAAKQKERNSYKDTSVFQMLGHLRASSFPSFPFPAVYPKFSFFQASPNQRSLSAHVSQTHHSPSLSFPRLHSSAALPVPPVAPRRAAEVSVASWWPVPQPGHRSSWRRWPWWADGQVKDRRWDHSTSCFCWGRGAIDEHTTNQCCLVGFCFFSFFFFFFEM